LFLYSKRSPNIKNNTIGGRDSRLNPKAVQSRSPQIGASKLIRNGMQRDNVNLNNEAADEVLQFLTQKPRRHMRYRKGSNSIFFKNKYFYTVMILFLCIFLWHTK